MYYFTGDSVRSTVDDSFILCGSSSDLRGSSMLADLGYVFGLDDDVAKPVEKIDLKLLSFFDLDHPEYKVVYEDLGSADEHSRLRNFVLNRNGWQLQSIRFKEELLTRLMLREQCCSPNIFYYIDDIMYILRDYNSTDKVGIMTYEAYKIRDLSKFKAFLVKSSIFS